MSTDTRTKRDAVLQAIAESCSALSQMNFDVIMGDAISAKSMARTFEDFAGLNCKLGVSIEHYRLAITADEKAEVAT